MDKNLYLYPEICKPCGGRCCKHIPGSAYPEDFPTAESLTVALKSGRWTIDWWEGDAREGRDEFDVTYFVRPAIKTYEGLPRHAAWGGEGECTFLTPIGCELEPIKRPRECRNLKPEKDGRCTGQNGVGKRGAAIAWLTRLHELVRKD